MLKRRTFLSYGAVFTTLAGGLPLSAALAQSARRKKLLFIIQRGAADGLVELAPLGDPAFRSLRGPWLEEAQSGTKLDSMFTLHPSLKHTAELYQAGDAGFIHATATSYRDRSHFDGQNILESGGEVAYDLKTGWLNRLISLLGETGVSSNGPAMALSSDIPLALRGPANTSNFTPSNRPEPEADLIARLNRLYGDTPALAQALQNAEMTREMAGDVSVSRRGGGTATGTLMARLMAGADGADIAMLETNDWDVHANAQGRMRRNLSSLDQMFAAFQQGMGEEWRDMLVIVATEFGRSVAINGTKGTDHGTGGLMMLLGGAVKGGQVVSDWPGLRQSQLLDGRDLRPTISQESAISGALATHFGIDPQRLQNRLFAHKSNEKPLSGLIAV